MVIIKERNLNEEQRIIDNFVKSQTETSIDTKLELLKYASEVQSRIRDEISSDFVLAKLEEKDKEAIIEMTSNAYFCKKLVKIMKARAIKYDWNKEEKEWLRRPLNIEEQGTMDIIAKSTFDSFMTRIYMTVILNRNVPQNYILRMLAGLEDEKQSTIAEEEMEQLKGMDKIKAKIKEALKGEQK